MIIQAMGIGGLAQSTAKRDQLNREGAELGAVWKSEQKELTVPLPRESSDKTW